MNAVGESSQATPPDVPQRLKTGGSSIQGVAALGLLLLGLGGCERGKADAPARTPEPRVHVEVTTVEEKSVPKTIRLTGVVDADKRTDLTANAAGRVTSTFVEIGQHVKKGDAIAKLDARAAAIDATEARANAESAAQQLVTAQSECDRYERLHAKGAVTDEEYERTLSQCKTQTAAADAARARVASATQNIADANVRAPFDGVIAARFVSAGDYVRADGKVVTLLVDDPLRVRLTVPEPFIGFVREGLVVSFETVARPGKKYAATVKYVGREVRPSTRDLVVEAVAPNRDGALVAGMFVTADLAVGTAMLPVVPRTALLPLEDGQSVFAVVGDRLQRRVVQTGYGEGDWVAAVEGVSKGERVVDKPAPTTPDGALVE